MSFGFSASDFVLLVQLAHRTFRNCQKAGEEYAEIACEVRCLYSVLRTLRTEVQNPESKIFKQDPASTKQLLATADGCTNVLDGLDFVLEKYEGLKPDGRVSGGKKLLQRLGFGSKAQELVVIRGKLVTYTSTISVLIDTLQIRAVDRVEGKIDSGFAEMTGQFAKMRRDIYAIASDHRAKEQLGAGVSSLSLSTFAADDKVVWEDFRRQLRQKGYGSQSLARHKHILIAYMLQLDESGLLDIDQSGRMYPVANGHRCGIQRLADSTDTLARVQLPDPMVEENPDSEDENIRSDGNGLSSNDQHNSSATLTDTTPRELQDYDTSPQSCTWPQSSDGETPKFSSRKILEAEPEYHDIKGMSNQAISAVDESRIHLETLEDKIRRPPTTARYTHLHRSVVSADLLKIHNEAYTKTKETLCLHRVLSRNEIEEYIALTAVNRKLSGKRILHCLFPRRHKLESRSRTTPFPLLTFVLRETISVRALQACDKDYILDSEFIIVLGSFQEREIAYCMKKSNKLRGAGKPARPRFMILRFYIMNGAVVLSDRYLDKTPVEDVDLDNISAVPEVDLADLISYSASLEAS